MPQHFWRVTPAELMEQLDAVMEWKQKELEAFRDVMLTHACIVVNFKDTKRPKLTVEKLIGKEKATTVTQKPTFLEGREMIYQGRWGNGCHQ